MYTSNPAAAQTRTDQRPPDAAAGGLQGGAAPYMLHGLVPPQWLWTFPYWIVPRELQWQAAAMGTPPPAPAAWLAHEPGPAAAQLPHGPAPTAQLPPGTSKNAWLPQQAPRQAERQPQPEPLPDGRQPQPEEPPAAQVQALSPVAPVPGVAMVAYPVLPHGARNRRYWL